MLSHKKLLVLVNDRLSEIIKKGELIDRYYNPGNVFDEVHIFRFYEDVSELDGAALKKLVGKASIQVHQILVKKSWFLFSFGWRPFLLHFFYKSFLRQVKNIGPNLIRCHDCQLNGFAGYLALKKFNVPYIVSLHTTPDESVFGVSISIKQRIIRYLGSAVESKVLTNASKVIPVYQSILPFLQRKKVNQIEIIYNVLNPSKIRKKESYGLNKPIKILSVGRQMAGKNPENIIRAMKGIKDATLTLVGNGELHQALKELAIEMGISEMVIFHPSIDNDDLCEMLPDFDIFVAHSEYLEISKSVLEPLLTGLPVIINKRMGRQVPELKETFLILTENTIQGYQDSINRLIFDGVFREKIGAAAYEHANNLWSPARMEEKYADLYKNLSI